MSIRGHGLPFVLLAVLLLPAGARAEEEPIYKWLDENGQVHFTATPPPRNARPIAAKPQQKGPIQIVPIPQSPKPASSARRTTHPKDRPRIDPRTGQSASPQASERIDCGRHAEGIQRVRSAQQTVSDLEQSIERLENDAVSSSRTSCNSRGERLGVCSDSSYNRDRELARTRERLTAAEDGLADAEAELRAEGVPRECLNKD